MDGFHMFSIIEPCLILILVILHVRPHIHILINTSVRMIKEPRFCDSGRGLSVNSLLAVFYMGFYYLSNGPFGNVLI